MKIPHNPYTMTDTALTTSTSQSDSIQNPTIILDTGTHSIKAGYSSILSPEVVVPPYIATATGDQDSTGLMGKALQEQLQQSHGKLPSTQQHVEPLLNEHGFISQWDKMASLWMHTLKHDMNITDFSDKNILITEPVMAPKPHREKLVKFAFEHLGVSNCYVASQAVMSIYAAGRISGIVMDVGHQSTKFVPIVEGFALQYASDRLNLAGAHVTRHLKDALCTKYPNLASQLNEYTVERIKEELAYTYCSTWHQGPQAEKSYQLPDNTTITLDDSLRKSSVEVLFSPHTVDPQRYETYGICSHLARVIGSCETSIRKDLYANVILSGGSTMVPTFKDRVRQEVDEHAPAATLVGIVAPRERIYGSYVGASILSTLSTFPNLWFSRQEYEDWGASGVHRKSLA